MADQIHDRFPAERIRYLFERYMEQSCTAAEEQELAALALASENETIIAQLEQEYWEKETGESMTSEEIEKHLSRILIPRPAKVKKMSWRKIAVAASIVVAIGSGAYFMFFNKNEKPPIVKAPEVPVDVKAPETNTAMITLADGRTVYLDSVGNGELARQGNVKLVKLSNGQIAYSETAKVPSTGGDLGEAAFNTLVNPRGSKVIDMQLSDGSRVWLNAGSSVTYPVAFIGNERKVSITGEAYFEAAPSNSPQGGGQKRPFIVSKGDMSVTVLGTKFNVNAYDDEADIKVTLFEGSVKVSNNRQPVVLRPGEQAHITGSLEPVTSNEVDLAQVMAWKDGWFEFDQVELPVIMRQVSRWYNLDIVYEGRIGNEKFGGRVNRELPLSGVLKMMESNGVAFKLEGKVLKVIP